MARITIEGLETIKERVNRENLLRSAEKHREAEKHSLDTTGSYRAHVLVCGGTGCKASHSEALYNALKQELEPRGLTLSLIHISEPTRPSKSSRMPSSA